MVNFLGWVDYFIFLPMALRWCALGARAPLKISFERFTKEIKFEIMCCQAKRECET